MLDDDVPAPQPRRSSRATFAAIYVLGSAIWLFPLLRTPVIADDFLNPFQQATSGGPGIWQGVRYGWEGAIDGASFRLVGNTFGALVNAVWLETTVRAGLSLEHLYAALKLAVLIVCALSLAWFAVTAARLAGAIWRFRPTLITISAVLFSTLQIHAFWSNDPVVSYPLAGFGATAIGITSMTMLLRLAERPTPRRSAAAAAVALTSFLYYELNLAAIIGSGFVVLAVMSERRRAGRPFAPLAGWAVAAVAPTAAALVVGRMVTGDQAAQYTGTTTRLGAVAWTTFVEGMISCLPGAGWELSDRLIVGGLRLAWWGVLLAVVVLAAVVVSRRWPRPAVRPDPTADRSAEDESGGAGSGRLVVVSIAASLCAYWALAIGLQAITVKVQDESRGIGYVYTASTVGSSVVALALAWAVRWLWFHTDRRRGIAALVVALAFVSVQQSVNWRLSSLMESTFILNSRLLTAFDDGVPMNERCARLERWATGAWPDYYELGMISGLQTAFDHYYDEEFCEGFVRPA